MIEALTDAQLLAALLDMNPKTAERLLRLHAGQLLRLFSMGPEATASWSPAHRTRFLAARELACRLASERVPLCDPLKQPEDVAHYLNLRYGVRDQEIFGALFLSHSKRLLSHREIYRGTLDRSSVETREVLKQALLLGAASLVFHTHPSGDPTPSLDDRLYAPVGGRGQAPRHSAPRVLGSTGLWTSMRHLMAW